MLQESELTQQSGKPPRRVVIIGGGLAGMTVAKKLLEHGVNKVVILESSDRLGGKAGADLVNGTYEEHGYHVFPGWYRNVRNLLGELGIEGNLVDIDRFYHLSKGKFPEFHAFYPISVAPWGWWNLARNITSGRLRWPESALSFFFMLDLVCESFDRRGYLDRVSSNGILRSRFYATEKIADLHQQTVLQSSAIPNYAISAMTTQKLGAAWLRTPLPMFSIMNGNLQEKFIAPFQRDLEKRGADIRLKRSVKRLELKDGRVSGLRLEKGTWDAGSDDIFVLATPFEVTLEFVDDDVSAAERAREDAPDDQKLLADLIHLKSAPMAALHVYMKSRVPGIPKEHVTLVDSRYGISFIDNSQHWEGADDRTVLSIISSDFESLSLLSKNDYGGRGPPGAGDGAARYFFEELQEFIPAIKSNEVDRWYMRPNVEVPLFLNTVGAWHFRPATRTRITDLYIAGDYCRTDADLTTMESAVSSGLSTAGAILGDLHLTDSVGPVDIPTYPRLPLAAMKFAQLPIVRLLSLFAPRRDWR